MEFLSTTGVHSVAVVILTYDLTIDSIDLGLSVEFATILISAMDCRGLLKNSRQQIRSSVRGLTQGLLDS